MEYGSFPSTGPFARNEFCWDLTALRSPIFVVLRAWPPQCAEPVAAEISASAQFLPVATASRVGADLWLAAILPVKGRTRWPSRV